MRGHTLLTGEWGHVRDFGVGQPSLEKKKKKKKKN
jgi:hypothetical protein